MKDRKKAVTAALPVLAVLLFAVLCIVLKTPPDRLIGAAFCHQIAARSPEHHFPFCHRCSGLFSGIFFGIIWFFRIATDNKVFSKKSVLQFAAAFILFIADILNSSRLLNIHRYPDKGEFRFLTAFPMGFYLAGIILPALHYFLMNGKETKRQNRPLTEIVFLLCAWAFSYFLIFSHVRIFLETARVMVCCGSMGFLITLYCILVHCAAAFRHTGCRLRTAVRIAAAAAFTQVSLFGFLHILLIPFDLLLQ